MLRNRVLLCNTFCFEQGLHHQRRWDQYQNAYVSTSPHAGSDVMEAKEMTWADALGYLAALLVLATFSMKTMLPLRMKGIASNCVFIAYGYFTSALPVVVLHLILLPLNSLRLY
jgi:hypothetical protein